MDFSKTSQPRFHQAAMATAFTLSIVSPLSSWAVQCDTPANPFVVNIATNSDDPCDDQISLQEAVTYANDHLGHDTITFAQALNGQRISAPETAIKVTENLSITGPKEPDLITLELSETDSLFELGNDIKIDFNLSNVVFENKESTVNTGHYIIEKFGGKGSDGGDIILDNIHTTANTRTSGIFTGSSYEDTLNMTLKNSSISGSIFIENIIDIESVESSERINISLEDTTISHSQATGLVRSASGNDVAINIYKIKINSGNWGGDGGKGGGVISAYSNQTATIKLSESSIHDIELTCLSILSIAHDSTSDTNSLLNIKNTKISGSISDPILDAHLIALAYDSSISIENSIISENYAIPVAIINSRDKSNSVLVKNTTISENNSNIVNSGIFADALNGTINVDIFNSTLSSNHAGNGDNFGGAVTLSAIEEGNINLSLNNSTITNNSSFAPGGGIALNGKVIASINNSIVAGNTSHSGSNNELLGSFDVENSIIGDTTTINSTTTINGIVIDQIGNGEGQTADTGNNILGQDPLLQELGLSGGVWVHQLNANSPAIGAGNADAENLAEFDQRGEGFKRVRTVNGTAQLDIGAVQYFAKPVAVNDVVSVEQNSENNAFEVLANDAQNSDGLALDVGSIVIMSHPEHGDAFPQPDGQIIYTPNAEFVGDDSFTYVVQDIDANTSSEATVSISVTELVITEPKEESASGSSGGAFNLWLLSILGLIGLRRRTK